MTVDDNNSIYVGGLPYDATEDSLRRVFDIYGAVVAVKIINDRTVGGKCFGFVTFTNPRSAMHAIDEMNGKVIDGRVVRVNEVKAKSGRLNFGRESLRRNSERDGYRGRGRERDQDYDKGRYGDARRERSRDRDQDKERPYDRTCGHDRSRDHYVDRSRDQEHNSDVEYVEHGQRNHDGDWVKDSNRGFAGHRNHYHQKDGDKDKDKILKSLNGSNNGDHSDRDFSSRSSDGDGQVEKQLEILYQKLEDLQKEISLMEGLAEEKKHSISKLKEKSKKLEDSVTAAKKLTSSRQAQLAKLYKCYGQVREYNERVKSSEQELQSLIDSTMVEMEYGDGMLANGNT